MTASGAYRTNRSFVKQFASAFFGTTVASYLTCAGVDTVILAGCTTSGCVRASAIDAMQHGFRTIIPRQCVADIAVEPHEAQLFDIDAKYGDVMDLDDVLAAFPALGTRLSHDPLAGTRALPSFRRRPESTAQRPGRERLIP